jgi:hypothetical protein
MTSIELLMDKLGLSIETYRKAFEQAKEMHKQEMLQLPQQEISDDEIEKFADEELGTIRTDFDFGVIQGMKWYREQLKNNVNGK